ncbi:hypothetical protein HK101_000740 [Irineochytrium annulatum]|nr:hypothetical protein HK101_000740 [Irineochytrium annulatum]
MSTYVVVPGQDQPLLLSGSSRPSVGVDRPARWWRDWLRWALPLLILISAVLWFGWLAKGLVLEPGGERLECFAPLHGGVNPIKVSGYLKGLHVESTGLVTTTVRFAMDPKAHGVSLTVQKHAHASFNMSTLSVRYNESLAEGGGERGLYATVNVTGPADWAGNGHCVLCVVVVSYPPLGLSGVELVMEGSHINVVGDLSGAKLKVLDFRSEMSQVAFSNFEALESVRVEVAAGSVNLKTFRTPNLEVQSFLSPIRLQLSSSSLTRAFHKDCLIYLNFTLESTTGDISIASTDFGDGLIRTEQGFVNFTNVTHFGPMRTHAGQDIMGQNISIETEGLVEYEAIRSVHLRNLKFWNRKENGAGAMVVLQGMEVVTLTTRGFAGIYTLKTPRGKSNATFAPNITHTIEMPSKILTNGTVGNGRHDLKCVSIWGDVVYRALGPLVPEEPKPAFLLTG